MNLLSCGPKASNSSGISDAISRRFIRKNPRNVYTRVPYMMAQFILKIEKSSHIIGTAPILEIARLRSPSPIMAPVWGLFAVRDHLRSWVHLRTRTVCCIFWRLALVSKVSASKKVLFDSARSTKEMIQKDEIWEQTSAFIWIVLFFSAWINYFIHTSV